MEFGEEKTAAGIIIQNLNGKVEGIKARWGRVWAVGPEQKDVSVGEWICVAHGRWTRGIRVQDGEEEITIRRVDNKDILIVSDEKPEGVYVPS
jgi:co-chaperonin GroES (HSP10)